MLRRDARQHFTQAPTQLTNRSLAIINRRDDGSERRSGDRADRSMFEQAPEGYGTAWASSKQGLQECGYGLLGTAVAK